MTAFWRQVHGPGSLSPRTRRPGADLARAITHSTILNGMSNVKVAQAIVGDSARQGELFLAIGFHSRQRRG